MKRILLLDGDNVQVVCMAKGLHKLGHTVSALCSHKCSSGYTTKWLDNRYICRGISESVEEYNKSFYELIGNNCFDLIIPMGDESAAFLSREKHRIEQMGIHCAVPEYDVFSKANDKQALMEVCAQYGIAHPRTMRLTRDNHAQVVEYVGLPAMIKPNLSAGAKGIMKVDSVEYLDLKYPYVEEHFGACTLQHFVEQPDYYYNVMLYRDRLGRMANWTIIKIRRYFPLKGGSSCYCETIEHPELLEQCKQVLDVLDWHGFADFDVLEDKNSGELCIIEINPRVPSSLQASFASGVDFADVIVSDEFCEPVPDFQYSAGKQIRWFGLDVMWFIMSPERFRFSPSWFKFFGKDVSYHDGSLSDPVPMLAGCLSGLIKYINPEFRKSKLDK